MSHRITVFSTFVSKELNTAKNIKDRKNRHNVVRILTMMNSIKIDLNNGSIIFAGIDETETEILEIITPNVKMNMFYYNCGDSFKTEICYEFIKTCSGNVVFADGDDCFIYKFDSGKFRLIKRLNGNLQKRQKKGGSSSARIARLAEESRSSYVTRIFDSMYGLVNNNPNEITLIGGSKEITDMVISKFSKSNNSNNSNNSNIISLGFIIFDQNTILDTKKWCNILNQEQNKIKYISFVDKYIQIIEYLETDVDMLDFDRNNKSNMEYYIDKFDENSEVDFPSLLNCNSVEIYSKLCKFEYIGVKYFRNNHLENEYLED